MAKLTSISPTISEVDESMYEKNPVHEGVMEAPKYHYTRSTNRYWNVTKEMFLAKAPLESAPIEYGGHRTPDETTKPGILGVFTKYSRFVGPGMILAVAFVDPDNFQSAVQDGQQFGYKLQSMILISLLITCFLQVSHLS
jgi:metal iron transporter